MPQIVRRNLHYRNAGFLTAPALTVEEMLSQALSARRRAVERERALPDDHFQVLNTHARIGGAGPGRTLCGVLHGWVRGQNQLVFDRDVNADVWPVSEVLPPAPPAPPPGQPAPAAPVRRDFLPFTLCFGVRGNHLVMLQSQGLLAPEFASYLTWFLRPPVQNLLLPENSVTFYPASARMLRQRGLDGAKAIRVTKALAETTERPPPANSRRTTPIIEKHVPVERARTMARVLRILGINAPDALLSDPEAKDLQVYLEIRRPNGRDPLGNSVMNRIGQLAAEHESDDYVVELLNGSELRGSELKLFKPVPVELADGSTHPSPYAIFRQIDEYLHELITGDMV